VRNKEMEVQVKTEDIQSVMAGNPQMALQVENQALRRSLGELEVENKRLTDELEKLKNGKKEK
jgi:regulator of replication initiation timing